MSEKSFLKNYDASKYEKPSVTVDMVVFALCKEETDNYRKLDDNKLKLLLIKRGDYPYKDCWALPGGFVSIHESIEEAAYRELKEETNVEEAYLEQLYTWGEVERDPRTRVISTSYMSLINMEATKVIANSDANDAKWFSVDYELKKVTKLMNEHGYHLEKSYVLNLKNEEESYSIEVKEIEDLVDRRRYKDVFIEENKLAFDHCKIIVYALERLRNKVEYSDIVFHLMPTYFSLTQLQQVYEVILSKQLLKANFRRKIAHMVNETDQVSKSAGHRPSKLYSFNVDWDLEE